MPSQQTKSWIVQKYGGTSIGKFLPSITRTILPPYLRTHRVAVVCSARSGGTKSKGTTSLLLEAIRLSAKRPPRRVDVDDIIDSIQDEHLHAAKVSIEPSATNILIRTQQQIKKDCEWLRNLLHATAMLAEISDRSTDRVLAVGETLSCHITAAALTSRVKLRRLLPTSNGPANEARAYHLKSSL